VKLGTGKLKDYKIVHLTGTTRFKLSEPARKEIKAFADAGGTLLIDAAGGSDEFAYSATDELVAIFGEPARKATTTALSPNHGVFTLSGLAIEKFDYRNFARGKRVGRLNTPRLAAVEANGRVVAYFSREDLSGGLVGQPVDGILGYTPETATDLMRNLLVYVATDGQGIAPKAKEQPKETGQATAKGNGGAKKAGDKKAQPAGAKPKAGTGNNRAAAQ
jgi:hypothetical protein